MIFKVIGLLVLIFGFNVFLSTLSTSFTMKLYGNKAYMKRLNYYYMAMVVNLIFGYLFCLIIK